MKVEVKIDLDDFIEKWGEDTFEECLKDEIKAEVLRAVKSSEKYKEIIRNRTDELMEKLEA